MKSLILSVLLTVIPISAFGLGKSNSELPRFYEVTPKTVFRGGQPSEIGFKLLSQMKIRTVLNIRKSSSAQIEEERNLVHQLGMRYISVPLSGILTPRDGDMKLIERILTNTSYQPVFVHCLHGQDRTGLVIGLYRVFHDRISPHAAYQEMLDFGFHPILFGLNRYFEEKTRFGAEPESSWVNN